VSGLLRISNGIRWVLEKYAFATAWLLILLMCVTCFDVVARKFGLATTIGIPGLLTRFQELEWWIHTAIFSSWMGYGYVINAHPRVDSYTEALTFRRRAWLELIGCLLFAFPYLAIISFYSVDFVYQSWRIDEGSESAIGLAHRWIVKGIYALGLWLVLLAIVSMILRLVAFLFGRVPRADADIQIGHVELEV
jgi:TRAP-type mannitol/chloroaromatic compound transport system permease small subunit